MKTLFRIVAIAAVMTASAAAHADGPSSLTKFYFSYTFTPQATGLGQRNSVISGSFEGYFPKSFYSFHDNKMDDNADMNVIYGIDNMQATYNGTDLGLNLYSAFTGSGPSVSFDGTDNDFISENGYSGANIFSDYYGRFCAGTSGFGNWSCDSLSSANKLIITQEVPTIPEPETYAMLLAGLGALGFVARRRKSL